MRAALLTDRAAIRITGADAVRFLNGLVTSEVAALVPGEARFAALLTPQGKIIADFLLVAVAEDEGGGFVIDAPRALAEELMKRLAFYRLRAKVDIAARPDLVIAVALDGLPPEDLGLAYDDPRAAGLGRRVVLPAQGAEAALAAAGFALDNEAEWQARRIAQGVPEGGKDFNYGDTFPHEADMDQLAGVDFEKGCFIGQEVVSRMQHRGTARNRVVPVAYDGAAPLPGIEAKVGERNVGFMGSAVGGRGLAMLRLDRVAEGMARGETLSAGGVALTLAKPAWAKFAFPGDAGQG
jgi:tRNA-modifying protein YgfZ